MGDLPEYMVICIFRIHVTQSVTTYVSAVALIHGRGLPRISAALAEHTMLVLQILQGHRHLRSGRRALGYPRARSTLPGRL
jgi:hypothetical protein